MLTHQHSTMCSFNNTIIIICIVNYNFENWVQKLARTRTLASLCCMLWLCFFIGGRPPIIIINIELCRVDKLEPLELKCFAAVVTQKCLLLWVLQPLFCPCVFFLHHLSLLSFNIPSLDIINFCVLSHHWTLCN